jgi:hypothetical protein
MIQLAEDLSFSAFGTSLHEHQRDSYTPVPLAYIAEAVKIVTRPHILAALAAWQLQDRLAPTGPKPIISSAALLTVMLIHAREGRGAVFTDMAATLTFRMNKEALNKVGIMHTSGSYSDWYERLWKAMKRLLKLVDPLPGNRGHVPTVEEYAAIVADRAHREEELQAKQQRLDWLNNQLVESSVQLLRKDIRDRHKGNVALDATKYYMLGAAGTTQPSERYPNRAVRIGTANYDAGWYVRHGDHDGSDATSGEKEWANELELLVMTANRPGESADFPLLAIAVGSHKPGAINLHAKRIFQDIEERSYPVGTVMADRAYLPGSKEEELQGHLRDKGWTMVFDYKVSDLGRQVYFEDAIQVDGQWYVKYMPDELIDAEKTYQAAMLADRKLRGMKPAARKSTPLTKEQKQTLRETRERQRAEREPYRMKPKGRVLPDGSQRFFYPDADAYDIINVTTGEISKAATKGSVKIPREVGLKFGQKFVHKSPKWKEWFGLRSTVEGHNNYLKDAIQTDISVAGLRPARGNAFAYLAVTMSVVASNVRKILTFLHTMKRGTPADSKNRAEIQSPFEDVNVDIDADVSIREDVLEPPPPN